jgi:hypothetical protein
MRIFRKRGRPVPADPGPPAGVILHYRGRAVGCEVRRATELDRRGCAAWLAVPAEPVAVLPGEKIRLTAAVLPAGTVLIADLASPPPLPGEDAWWLPAG